MHDVALLGVLVDLWGLDESLFGVSGAQVMSVVVFRFDPSTALVLGPKQEIDQSIRCLPKKDTSSTICTPFGGSLHFTWKL